MRRTSTRRLSRTATPWLAALTALWGLSMATGCASDEPKIGTLDGQAANEVESRAEGDFDDLDENIDRNRPPQEGDAGP